MNSPTVAGNARAKCDLEVATLNCFDPRSMRDAEAPSTRDEPEAGIVKCLDCFPIELFMAPHEHMFA
jgi:hypothetical protein